MYVPAGVGTYKHGYMGGMQVFMESYIWCYFLLFFSYSGSVTTIPSYCFFWTSIAFFLISQNPASISRNNNSGLNMFWIAQKTV